MGETMILLVGAVALATLVLGRIVRSQVVRKVAGGLAFLAAATAVQWLVQALHGTPSVVEWADAAVLLALGYLLMRLLLLLVFEWLLIRRFDLRVPRLALDVIGLVLYLLVAAAILRAALGLEVGALLSSAALLTVVVGFALQETLGTLLSGLALTWEQKLAAGSWVEIDGVVGEVQALGWRSLVVRTTLGERVMFSNSQVARARVRLLGEGDHVAAVPVRLGVAYDAPPHAVKEVLSRVAADVPLLVAHPAPKILAREFADSAVVYECRLWTREPWRAPDIADAFLTNAHAALARAGMEIPFPQRSVRMVTPAPGEDRVAMSLDALELCDLFAGLPESALKLLAGTARWQEFAPGETVVREGEASRAMFVIARGEAVVDRGGAEIARVGEGEVFGEMAFLSGEPRAATVRAGTAMSVVEIDTHALRALLFHQSRLAEELATRMGARQQELATREAPPGEVSERRSLTGFLLERLQRLVVG
ncbi:MAG TPA: mechanosensitive ion channel family protein [Thermoanaerobaculaceae bacterium]|nr:mechanosensitive ion channel family protein [Thermoanaerobaculaceae bacterium]